MNKIAIHDLLNPPNTTKTHEQLESINTQLNTICSVFPTTENLDFKTYQEQLRNIAVTLSSLTNQNELSSENKNVLRVTYQISSVLLKLLGENAHNKDQPKTPTSGSESERNPKLVFNILTKKRMSPTSNEPRRGHRLAKEKVDLLEHWYIQHMDNPYLNKAS